MVIRTVTDQFVPVAENVSELQVSDDEKGRFFRSVAVQGRMKGRSRPGVSHQGIYAFTSDGTTLSSGNPLEAEKTMALLREALAQWDQRDSDNELPLGPAASGDDNPGYPEDGAVLRLTARDLPRAAGASVAESQERFEKTWNNDFVWLGAADVGALVPASFDPGTTHHVHQSLLRRLARFHLRDIVRGEPWVWGTDAVEHIELAAEVIGRDGAMVTFAYRGCAVLGEHVEFRDSHNPIDWAFDNALDAAIAGEAVWNDDAGVFASFDLLVAGQRSGAHRYNVRTHDPGPAPIGFSLELAGDAAWERTPPHVVRTRTGAHETRQSGPVTASGEPYYGNP